MNSIGGSAFDVCRPLISNSDCFIRLFPQAVSHRQRQQDRKENAKSSKGEHGEKSEVVTKDGERIATQTVQAEDQSDLNTVHSLERYFEAV